MNTCLLYTSAVRGCEIKLDSMIAPRIQKQSDAEIKKGVARTDDQRLFHICEALRRGIMTIEEIHDITTMDVFFLHKFQNIIDMEKELASAEKIDSDLYIRAKKMGFLDKTIEQLSGKDISDAVSYTHLVSMPARPTTFCALRYSSSVTLQRQLDGYSHISRMIKPETQLLRDS